MPAEHANNMLRICAVGARRLAATLANARCAGLAIWLGSTSTLASGWQKKTNSLLHSTSLQARFTYKSRYLYVVPVTTLSYDPRPLTPLASALPWNPRTR